jgi:hypothetical protein
MIAGNLTDYDSRARLEIRHLSAMIAADKPATQLAEPSQA